MYVSEWLEYAVATLASAEVPTARLDALVLLEDALGVDRAKLLAHPDMEIPADTQNVLKKQLARRAEHEPLAYVRGKTEFYGREFVVSEAVLEPRPESETMIELLLRYKNEDSSLRWNDEEDGQLRIGVVGTGSGALGITAQLELPEASVELLEVDDRAIEVAKVNVIKFTSGIPVLKADLLEGSSQDYDVLLCNLPYVPDDHTINASAMHEPKIAIFGGPDGLDLFRRLFDQVQKLPKQPLLILCESLPPQHEALKTVAEAAGYQLDAEEDFIQSFVPVA
jgi:release factor glutamine methyltransferase